MSNNIFWVTVSGSGPMKFDYDRDEDNLAKGYPSYDEYFRSFVDGWEDGHGNPVRAQYVVQDAEPDETTVWLDGPLSGSLH